MAEPSKLTEEQKNLLENEEKRKSFMYTGIAMCRNNEVTLRWSRSAILSLINGGILTFMGAQRTHFYLVLSLGIGAIILCAFWRLLNWKTQIWIDYWNSCLAKMEPPESDLLIFRVFTGTAWRKINKRPTFHNLLNFLPYAFIFLWAGLIVWFAILHKQEPTVNNPIIFFQLNTKGGGQ